MYAPLGPVILTENLANTCGAYIALNLVLKPIYICLCHCMCASISTTLFSEPEAFISFCYTHITVSQTQVTGNTGNTGKLGMTVMIWVVSYVVDSIIGLMTQCLPLRLV